MRSGCSICCGSELARSVSALELSGRCSVLLDELFDQGPMLLFKTTRGPTALLKLCGIFPAASAVISTQVWTSVTNRE